MTDGRHHDEGFTLVEVIAAIFIFVVISASTITILLLALDTVEGNNDRVIAANVARSRIEQLRVLGADAITPGLTYDAPPRTPADFTVETSAQWVGAGQTASACETASPGQAYLRVRVAASSPNLPGPAVMDTIIAPEAAGDYQGTAAIAVSVEDQNGSPVAGVRVAALDPLHPENSFTYATGSDGCLYIPGLIAGGDIDITVSKDGYVPPLPSADRGTSALDPGSLAKPTFLLAPASGIDFVGGRAGFPLAVGVPVTWQVSETGAVVESGAIGTPVTGRWPTTSGFVAWAGSCPDADPESYGQSRATYDFTPGGSTLVELDTAPVRLIGLPPDTAVTARHVGGCAAPDIPAGTSDETGVVKVGLPFGTWEFTATAEELTETVTVPGPLEPPADGSAAAVTELAFTLAEQLAPSPSPSDSLGPSIPSSPTPTASP